MPLETVVEALVTVLLALVDRETAKKELDRVAVKLANRSADLAEDLKFGATEASR